MPAWWTPARRRGVEVLDDPATADAVRVRAMADVATSNVLFGGTRAVDRAVRGILRSDAPTLLLDLGTGTADIPARLMKQRPNVIVVGLDVSLPLLRTARVRLHAVVAGSALRLPLADDSIDVVICSQLLHHFEEADAAALIQEAHRVARGWVVLSDLRRSWIAAAGFWIASTALRFHPVTRHDGVVSVMRGFTGTELRALVRRAVGADPMIEHGLFWRLTATWAKSAAAAAPAYT